MKMTSMLRVWTTKSLKPFEFLNDYDELLDFESTELLGLYVHIPFCRTLCAFCPYCKVVYDKVLAEQYLTALLKEIELVGSQLTELKTVDVDLIFAIPGQTTKILLKDIETAFQNGATQVSTYPFIDFTFANNRYKPLPEKDKKRMLADIAAYARQNGYNAHRFGPLQKRTPSSILP